MLLILLIQFDEVTAPTPYPDDQIPVRFRVRLRVRQHVAVDGVQLQLVTAQTDKCHYQLCTLFDFLFVTEYAVVQLHGERAAVDQPRHIEFGKRTDTGERPRGFAGERRRESGPVHFPGFSAVRRGADVPCRVILFVGAAGACVENPARAVGFPVQHIRIGTEQNSSNSINDIVVAAHFWAGQQAIPKFAVSLIIILERLQELFFP